MKKAILYAMCYAALIAEFIKKIINTVKLIITLIKKNYKKVEYVQVKDNKYKFIIEY